MTPSTFTKSNWAASLWAGHKLRVSWHQNLWPTLHPSTSSSIDIHTLLLLLLLSRFSRVRLCVTPQTAAHQAPPPLGFSRQEHWSGLPFPSPVHESEKWKWSRSVVSDSQRPHGLQRTRLLHPWDFPGKSTGVGCHRLLQDSGNKPQTPFIPITMNVKSTGYFSCCSFSAYLITRRLCKNSFVQNYYKRKEDMAGDDWSLTPGLCLTPVVYPWWDLGKGKAVTPLTSSVYPEDQMQ